VSESGFSALAGPYPDDIIDRHDEDLPVTDLAGTGGRNDRLDSLFNEGIGNHRLDLDLREQIDLVFAAAVELGMPPLPAETADFGHGHPAHAQGHQGFPDGIEFERLDDRFDPLHAIPVFLTGGLNATDRSLAPGPRRGKRFSKGVCPRRLPVLYSGAMNTSRRQPAEGDFAPWLDPSRSSGTSPEALRSLGLLDAGGAARRLADLGAGETGDRWRERADELAAALAGAPDPDLALGLLQRLDADPGSSLPPARRNDLGLLLTLLGSSPFLGELLTSRPERITWLLDDAGLEVAADVAVAQLDLPGIGESADSDAWLLTLNQIKRRELLRIGSRAAAGLSTLEEEFSALSRLAEIFLGRILDAFWPPNLPVPIVLAAGKLGGCELNFSSDLDLIFAQPLPPEAPPAGILHPATRAVEQCVDALTRYTASGMLYRIDLRLRPGGDRAPLIPSTTRLLAYYAEQGAPWERQMLVRARCCAGDRSAGERLLAGLEPFIYPQHAEHDPREEAHRLRRERRSREGSGSDPRDVKFAPGGIRDVEFVVQVLQLLYGGRERDLRRTGTQEAIAALTRGGFLPEENGDDLNRSYAFARRCEHLIQMQDDRQEFTLPAAPGRLRALARMLGEPDGQSLLATWDRHRERVLSSLQVLLPGLGEEESGEPVESLLTLPPGGEEAVRRLSSRGFQRPAHSHRVILATASGIRAGGAGARAAFIGLLPPLLSDARDTGDPDRSLNNLERILRRLGSPGAYARLMAREPALRKALLTLCASGDYLPDLLTRHPEHFERLFSRGAASEAATASAWRQRLQRARHHARSSRELAADLESFRTREFLAAGLAYLAGERTLESLMAHLAGVARDLVRCFLGYHFRDYLHPPRFATFSLGTLSAGFMTFASDADLLFVHAEGSGAAVQNLTAQVAGLLSPPGGPYSVDMRLRPEGRSSPTSADISYLRDYLHERASAWEALALCRFRPLYGRRALLAPAAAAIEEWLGGFAFTPAVAAELGAVRRRQEEALGSGTGEELDVKRSPGAMADIEFVGLAQALAAGLPPGSRPAHLPELMPAVAAAGRLTTSEADLLAAHYQELRRIQIGLQLHYGRDSTRLPSTWPEDIVPVPLRGVDYPGLCERCRTVRQVWERFYRSTP